MQFQPISSKLDLFNLLITSNNMENTKCIRRIKMGLTLIYLLQKEQYTKKEPESG